MPHLDIDQRSEFSSHIFVAVDRFEEDERDIGQPEQGLSS